ncbi:MarR family transcriptional regulator [bacterium]|nr:MarR family transcriptional regulator [bacterium]
MKMKEIKWDWLDEVVEDWQRESPELDPSGLAVFGRISAIGYHMDGRVERLLKQFGVPLWGFDVLFALRRVGRPYTLSPTQLMKACFLTSGAMTHRLDRLEQQNHIERRHSKDDRRSVDIVLTPSGKDLVERALPVRLGHGVEMLGHLSANEVQQLTKLLRKVLVNLEELDEAGR